MRLILASGSPRRKELLGRKYPDFTVMTSEVDETLPSGTLPECGVELLAVRKGQAVLETLRREGADRGAVILSSDTLVEIDGEPLGKPQNREEAKQMLEKLSGRVHFVHTGVAVACHGRVFSGVDSTAVHFRTLSEGEIPEYIATGEPDDKAGAYAIQGIGGKFVEKIDGEFDTVMGLSMRLVEKLMKEAGAFDEE